jgi:hypothetical protein
MGSPKMEQKNALSRKEGGEFGSRVDLLQFNGRLRYQGVPLFLFRALRLYVRTGALPYTVWIVPIRQGRPQPRKGVHSINLAIIRKKIFSSARGCRKISIY